MVVVIVIGVLATLAVPSFVFRMKERRSSEAAQRIAALYRNARLRAMGRGSAVMVHYANGVFTVSEAIVGAANAVNPNCANLPSNSCKGTVWTAGGNHSDVTSFTTSNRAEYEEVTITSATPQLDVCFTPLGAAYEATAANAPLQPMLGVHTFDVGRSGGLTRTITVLPNGVARLAL